MNCLNNLKKLRLVKGLTRDELAKLSGVNSQTIKALEMGLNNADNVKLSTLIKLAHGLECKVIDLLPIDIKRKII